MAKNVTVIIIADDSNRLKLDFTFRGNIEGKYREVQGERIDAISGRVINCKNDDDFRKWMFELINFWEVQPLAIDEKVAELVKQKIQGYPIQWKGEYYTPEPDGIRAMIRKDNYTIEELLFRVRSENLDITPRTIRYYEQIGLLPKPEHQKRKRIYKPEVLDVLHCIDKMKKQGKTLDEIKMEVTAHKC